MPNQAQPDLQQVIAALNSPVRREILALVWDTELAAGQIATAFPVTKPTISQHLAVLRRAGLVTVRAVGTSRRYRARAGALEGLRDAVSAPGKWSNADDLPERALASTSVRYAAVVSTQVSTGPHATFAAFTDPVLYSRWLGVPVTIDDGRFAAAMEWGTQVRGRYELACPPELIVMRWDFDDGSVPVPGGELTAYLRIRPAGPGSHVEVHQLAGTQAQARFMESAWAMVLGRLAAGVAAATGDPAGMPPRAPRRKQRPPGAPPAAE